MNKKHPVYIYVLYYMPEDNDRMMCLIELIIKCVEPVSIFLLDVLPPPIEMPAWRGLEG